MALKYIGHTATIERIPPLADMLPSIFVGPDGVGKMTFIRAYLLRGIRRQNILHHETPSVAQVRELSNWAKRKPLNAKFKVALLDITRSSTEANNALLKLLEEPPSTVRIILISHTLNVLPTILSRCQIYRFNPLSRDQVVEVLLQQGWDRATAVAAADFADGSISKAHVFSDSKQLLMELGTIMAKGSPSAIAEDLLLWQTRSRVETAALIELLAMDGNITPEIIYYLTLDAASRGKTLLSLMTL